MLFLMSLGVAAEPDPLDVALLVERREVSRTDAGSPRWIAFGQARAAVLDTEGWGCVVTLSSGVFVLDYCVAPAQVPLLARVMRDTAAIGLVAKLERDSAIDEASVWGLVGGPPTAAGVGCDLPFDPTIFPRGVGDVATGDDGATWYVALDDDHVLSAREAAEPRIVYATDLRGRLTHAYNALCGAEPTAVTPPTMSFLQSRIESGTVPAVVEAVAEPEAEQPCEAHPGLFSGKKKCK